ncbi:SDR family oxidoreductase [Caproiciproducens sp. NJN-50]|uniref:SDR family NAD(P)-dependent oxidoreductase n=1 Tax=Acutalibacteraceae TaxID=3082771 RepID=UPI000FFDFC90|nr:MULTISPECIES: SDR family oxidoreductase [Acutalibacteraceae]QAT50545.1 SDR family oxidoreductase [Caproiciproducens sp. NJN-50]
MNLMLDGKVVVVTGGATGIGKSIARAFAEEGCKIAVGARRKEKLDEVQREFESLGYPVFTKQMNVACERDVAEFSEAVSAAFGRIDVWVNNAGQTCHDRMDEVSLEFWRQVIDTNLTGVFLGSKYAARQMRKTGGGVIFNAGSFQSIFPAAGSGPYGAAKAGVCSLTRSFAAEYAKDNIRVLTYIPGVIETPMTKIDNWAVATGQQGNIPVNRLGRPEDIANAVVFLASDKASYINGVSVEITGGKFCVQNPRYSWDHP